MARQGDPRRASTADAREVEFDALALRAGCAADSGVARVLKDAITRAWRRERAERLEVLDSARLSAGASAETSVLDVRIDGAPARIVVQLLAGRQFGSALGRHDQARIQQLAHRHGVPTPEVLLRLEAAADCPEGFVSRHMDGETLGRRIATDPELADARALLTGQCADALAAIHALPLAGAAWLPLRSAAQQLDELERIHRGHGDSLPVFELALAWLRRHQPPACDPHVVHGDFRNGNLIVDRRGLVAVLDWELAHLGDPMEDLGWLCQRAWRFGEGHRAVGGFGERPALYAAYERASGRRVDHAAVHFWELLGTLKWGVICQWFGRQFLTGEVPRIERLAIGRRISEVELDLLDLLQGAAQ
ncbi:MAG: phosphotransferase family protein [Steroidobacteraceae bacterium]